MKTCIALIALIVWIMGIAFGLDLQKREVLPDKQKYCGKYLANALSFVCDGVYNNQQKKSVYKNVLNGDDYNDVEPFQYADGPLPFPFKIREHANAIIPAMQFRKRGIVDECCVNACTLYELTGYCGRS